MSDTKTITLTTEEINTITCYIRMTTKHREGEAEAWEKLAAEKSPDGSPKFKHAADNARFWREEEGKLAAIVKKLEA